MINVYAIYDQKGHDVFRLFFTNEATMIREVRDFAMSEKCPIKNYLNEFSLEVLGVIDEEKCQIVSSDHYTLGLLSDFVRGDKNEG